MEVGAVDGIHVSNTLHFEQLGWQCLCIEPNSHYHADLARNRKLFLPYAVANRNEDDVILHRVKVGNTYDAGTALELDPKLIRQFGLAISEMDDIRVNVRTLDACLDEVGWTHVDFVSIDTEGTELSAVQGFSLDRWNPKLMVIENNFGTPEVEDYVKTFGYHKVLKHHVNDFYLKI